ncbi:MAG: CinA family protein, partial [Hyphomicrobium sp.]
AIDHSTADVAVSVTGVAGPGGGTPSKPVGLVYIAAKTRSGRIATAECRFGDIGRSNVRVATLRAALALVREIIS